MANSPRFGSRPYFKLRKEPSVIVAAAETGEPWNVPDLCAAYNWPTGRAGGVDIASVELGGGWVVSDLDSSFESLGQPVPSVTDVSVDGTQNTPNQSGSAGDADYEVALDIEVAGASYYAATGQAATIRVYWSQDIGTAVAKAASDGCDVCTISWGSDEANWGATAAEQMESTAESAVVGGMIVFGASGDNDSGDGGPTPANVDCPSSCPHVVGCGGTNKTATSEAVWNDNPGETNGEGTGGGYSTIFPVQVFQIGAPPAPANGQLWQRPHDSRHLCGCRSQHRLQHRGSWLGNGGRRHQRGCAALRRGFSQPSEPSSDLSRLHSGKIKWPSTTSRWAATDFTMRSLAPTLVPALVLPSAQASQRSSRAGNS